MVILIAKRHGYVPYVKTFTIDRKVENMDDLAYHLSITSDTGVELDYDPADFVACLVATGVATTAVRYGLDIKHSA